MTWGFRIGGPITALLALGLILKLQFRADLQPDYLRPLIGSYFNRDGFCFGFITEAIDGVAYIVMYFQSQYDKPSLGRVAVRPARGFFMTRAKIDAITFEIDCPPAGFGTVRIAFPIPEKQQGKLQSFEVGASVSYPEGKGERVRFHDGVFLRSNSNFSSSFNTAVTVAGAAGGSLILTRPATIKVELPDNVAEEIDDTIEPETKLLWQLGDPPLKSDK